MKDKMANNDTHSLKEVLSALADDEIVSTDRVTDEELIELACRDRDAMSSWQCIHLTRDVMQADYHPALKPDFAARVSEQIELEDEIGIDSATGSVASISSARQRRARPAQRVRHRGAEQPTNRQQPFSLWKPVAGLGLAASLAGATFLFSQLWLTESSNPNGGNQVASVQNTIDPTDVQQVALQQTQGNTVSGSEAQDGLMQAAVRIGNRGTRWRMDSAEVPRNQQIEERLNMLLTNHLEDASTGGVHGMLSHSRVVGYDSVPAER